MHVIGEQNVCYNKREGKKGKQKEADRCAAARSEKGKENEEKKAQSSALLECATARRMEAARRGEQRGGGVRGRERERERDSRGMGWLERSDEGGVAAREGATVAAECASLSVI
jgi:hypothetical protein